MSHKNIHTPPSMMGMIGTDKPQFIPEQVRRALADRYFGNSTATVVAHITLVGADGKPIAYGNKAVIETSEERKDGFGYETE